MSAAVSASRKLPSERRSVHEADDTLVDDGGDDGEGDNHKKKKKKKNRSHKE